MGQVKKQNRSLILQCINNAGTISRKDVAEQTGLTPAAVTLICNELIQEGLLVEGDTVKKAAGTGAGRRKVLISINYKSHYFVALAIELDKAIIAITDMQGNPLKKETLHFSDEKKDSEKLLSKISDEIKKQIQDCPKEIIEKIHYGAVSIPGIVNNKKGTSVAAYGIWEKEVNVCSILAEKTGLKFTIENNVTAFTRAEQIFGTGKYKENLLVIKWGPGLGAANSVENQIFTGFIGRSAEIGHFIVDPNGEKCVCGQTGCLETLVSSKALKNKNEDYEKKAIEMFGITLANLLKVISPDRIILYGELAQNERYLKFLKASIQKYNKYYDDHRVRYTRLASEEDYIGPVSVALDEFIFLGNDV